MRLIDADALGIGPCKPELFEKPGYGDGWNSAIRILQSAETVDPVKHAKWEVVKTKNEFSEAVVRCSNCGYPVPFWWRGGDKYCCNCGAKMDEKGAVTDGEDKGKLGRTGRY